MRDLKKKLRKLKKAKLEKNNNVFEHLKNAAKEKQIILGINHSSAPSRKELLIKSRKSEGLNLNSPSPSTKYLAQVNVVFLVS